MNIHLNGNLNGVVSSQQLVVSSHSQFSTFDRSFHHVTMIYELCAKILLEKFPNNVYTTFSINEIRAKREKLHNWSTDWDLMPKF